MLKNHLSRDKEKLIPLRKFSVEDVYSPAYLSQLVQRGKLKAKRIGRNYYTSEKWFSEYLEQHAHDAKYEKYQEYLNKKSKKSAPGSSVVRTKNNKFAATRKYTTIGHSNIWKQIAISMAVFLLFIVIGLGLYVSYNQGRIAGVEEQYNQSADVPQTLRGINAED
ncbi:hypothetical protein KAJ89_01460 [Candidatus Parcubacteria bacterium]|nr:hypothetical protein [Candidatus Parcubacteria bacterium]